MCVCVYGNKELNLVFGRSDIFYSVHTVTNVKCNILAMPEFRHLIIGFAQQKLGLSPCGICSGAHTGFALSTVVIIPVMQHANLSSGAVQ